MDNATFFRLAHVCERVFDLHDLTVDETNEAAVFEERMVAVGKSPCQLPFDDKRNALAPHRTMGLILRQGDQDAVGILVRNLDLGERCVAEILDWEAAYLYGVDRVRHLSCPTAYDAKGNVAYFGEMHVGPAGRNKLAMTAALVRYAQCIAFTAWRLDWSYALIKNSEMEKKARDIQYGFSIRDMGAQDLEGATDPRRDSSEWMVANCRKRFLHIAKTTAENRAMLPGYQRLLERLGIASRQRQSTAPPTENLLREA